MGNDNGTQVNNNEDGFAGISLANIMLAGGSDAERKMAAAINAQQPPATQQPATQQPATQQPGTQQPGTQTQQVVVDQNVQQQNNVVQQPTQDNNEFFEQIETPLGTLTVKKGDTQAPAPVAPATFEDAFGKMSNEFGMEIKSPMDVVERLVPAFKESRRLASQAGDLKVKYESLESGISSLPQEIKESIQLWASDPTSTEWKSALTSKSDIDYSVPADKVDVPKLIEHYYPGKFTAEELSDSENEKVAIARDASVQRYRLEKEQKDKIKQDVLTKAQRKLESVSASVDESINSVSDYLKLPNLDEGRVKEVKEVLSSGSIESIFKEADGTWKKDAAAKLLLSLYGNEVIGALTTFIENRAKSKANEEIVDRGAQTQVKGSGTQVQHNDAQKEAQAFLTDLLSGRKLHFS